MAFYTPRNIGPADQVLFDADGKAVGIQPAASSSPPVLGFNPTKHAAIDSLVSDAGNLAVQALPDVQPHPYPAMTYTAQVASAMGLAQTTGRNLHAFRRALRRSRAAAGTGNQPPVRVLFVTDSTGENVSQNYPQAHWVVALARQMEQRWPDALFTWFNVGIGGRDVRHVLGLSNDMVTVDYLAQVSDSTTGWKSQRMQTADTAYAHPWRWAGPPDGVTWNVGDVWGGRAAQMGADLVITMFGLNEHNDGTNERYVEPYEALIADIRSGSRWAASRPSIAIGLPYGDSLSGGDMVKRNDIAALTRGIAEKHGCPILDGNRWYNILRHGRDPLRRRVWGEVYARYLRTSRDNGVRRADYLDYWLCPLAQPNAGSEAGTFISATNNPAIFLRKRAGRNVDIAVPFVQSTAAATGIARLFARVDPNQWWFSGTGVASDPVAGYEARYNPSGLLELLHNGSVLTSVQCPVWNTTSMPLRMQMILNDTYIEVWSAVGTGMPATGTNWARRIRFQHLPTTYLAAESNTSPRSIRSDGWMGFGFGTTGVNTPTVTAKTAEEQAPYLQWMDDLPVSGVGIYSDTDLQGVATANWVAGANFDPDYAGGNGINHLSSDAYEVTFGAPVAAFVQALSTADQDSDVLGWSADSFDFTSNQGSGSIARSGTVATFTWTSHGYPVGRVVRVGCTGAGDAGYNVTHECTVTDASTLTATVSGALAASEATVTLTTRNIEQIAATIPVPAGWFGRTGVIDVQALYDVTNSANTKNLRVRHGTTGVASANVVSQGVTATEAFSAAFRCYSRGDASQVWVPSLSWGNNSGNPTTGSVNTTGLTYIYLTVNAANTGGNETCSLVGWTARLVA